MRVRAAELLRRHLPPGEAELRGGAVAGLLRGHGLHVLRWSDTRVGTYHLAAAGHVCPTTTSPAPCICPAVFSPVCATNNLTFSNACQAACSGLAPGCNVSVSITVNNLAHVSPCQGACPCPDCTCLHVWTPVCGGDGVTYSNAGCAACARAEVRCQGECPCD